MNKTMITLRVPDELLAKMQEEAVRRKRSRAFIAIEAFEQKYAPASNGHIKTAAPKKKAGTR
jgi:predicted transcriptional regulator